MTSLRMKFREFMELRNLSPRTIESYLQALIKLSRFYHESPEKLSQEKVFHYVLYLQNEEKREFSTCNVALSAFKCFCNQFLNDGTLVLRVPPRKGPKKIPAVYSQEEAQRLIENARSPKYRLIFMAAYGAGLRLSELVNLKVSYN